MRIVALLGAFGGAGYILCFIEWRRRLPPEQFEVREVCFTHARGPTHVGLFSKELVRAERRENQERLWGTRGGNAVVDGSGRVNPPRQARPGVRRDKASRFGWEFDAGR
jgi:hypothetical protein